MTLTEGQKILLERIHQLGQAEEPKGNPSTPELAKDEDVARHYEKSSLRKTLRQLGKDGYIDVEKGKPNRYEVTEDGYTVVKKIRDKQNRRVERALSQDNNGVSVEEAVDKFNEYFSSDEINNEVADTYASGKKAYLVDYQELQRLDSVLADKVLEDPEDMINAAEYALKDRPIIDGEMNVRFRNIPDYHSKNIRELSASDIDNLVTVPGIVLKASMTKPILIRATFECMSCGEIYRKKQPTGKLRSPYKCECGSRKFETLDKTFDNVRILKLQEKPDSPDKKTIKVRVFGRMADEKLIHSMKPGTAVKLTGVLAAEDKGTKSRPEYELYIKAIDVEEEQNKWEEIELTDEDRERNQDILEYGPVKAFQESLAPDKVSHRNLMKEAFLLFLLGKTETNGNLHVLVMGEPGTAKSELNNWVEQKFPKTVKAVATTATGVGLTATVKEDKDFGGYVAEGGSLTMADRGYHITDEFDKIREEDVPKFNEALSEGRITLNKGDVIDLKLDADVSEWTTANPLKYDYFDTHEKKYRQIPVPQDSTKDRFDVIIGLEEYKEKSEQKQDVIDHILRRGSDDFEGTEAAFSADELVKFVTEASRLNPKMTAEALDVIKDVWFSVKRQEADDERLITNRTAGALKKLCIAYARAHLSGEVTKDHAQWACNFYHRSLESIDFEVGKDSFTEIKSKPRTDKEKVLSAVESLEDSGSEEVAEMGDIVEKSGLDGIRVEEVLGKLEEEGEVFEARASGTWKTP